MEVTRPDREQQRPVIVVDVDGSSESVEATQWAARYAALVGGRVRAVTVWQPDVGFDYFPERSLGLDREAAQTLERTLETALGTERAVGIERVVRAGNPTSVLVEESTRASLLVVGDRVDGGFAGLLLGSVGEHCVRHAKCSVVVVRDNSVVVVRDKQ